MTVRLVYFAWVRERVGAEGETIALPPDCVTAGDLADHLALRYPLFADRTRLRVAVNHAMAGWETDIGAATEIAFFPPVTGG